MTFVHQPHRIGTDLQSVSMCTMKILFHRQAKRIFYFFSKSFAPRHTIRSATVVRVPFFFSNCFINIYYSPRLKCNTFSYWNVCTVNKHKNDVYSIRARVKRKWKATRPAGVEPKTRTWKFSILPFLIAVLKI